MFILHINIDNTETLYLLTNLEMCIGVINNLKTEAIVTQKDYIYITFNNVSLNNLNNDEKISLTYYIADNIIKINDTDINLPFSLNFTDELTSKLLYTIFESV